MNLNELISLILGGIKDTLIMTLVASGFAFVLGGILGIILVLTKKGGLKENLVLYRILDTIVNLMRSVPFVILMLTLMPLSKLILGTTIGVAPTTFTLIIAAIPFVGRLVENVLSEVDSNLIEMARAFGASTKDILFDVILNESWPSLIKNFAVAMVTILGYGAMAGFTGGGGLGVIAINYGYYRSQSSIMFVAIIAMILIVQLIELLGTELSKRINRKN